MSSEALLHRLERSELFAPDFPKRIRLTHQEWARLSDPERRATRNASHTARARIPDPDPFAHAVAELGAAHYEPAVPVLGRLWTECALDRVRAPAGHALRAIGTPAALDVLESMIEDSDPLSAFLAVRAIFDRDPSRAYDRLARYFEPARLGEPGGSVIAEKALATFVPHAVGGGGVGWVDSRAPDWLREDTRWIALCATLRTHKQLGPSARDVLKQADPELVNRVTSSAKPKREKRAGGTRKAGDLVERYLRGEHDKVWRELRAHKVLEGEQREEAVQVARETMRRVALAADVLAARLSERGWRALSGSLRTAPATDDGRVLTQLDAVAGPLPPSISAFWEVVGGIDFIWDDRDGARSPDVGVDLALAELDPLAIVPARAIAGQLEEWEDDEDAFDIELAPDYLHKVNVSGGAPYSIALPFGGADPIFENEEHGLPFVDYLRLCVRWAGFPRLERHGTRTDVQAFVRDMTTGIEPF